VLVVFLLLELAPGKADLVGVDDDDMIAAIYVGGEARLVLAAQDIGDDRRDAPDNQAVGIDQVLFLLDFRRLCRLGRLHQRLHGPEPLFQREKAAPQAFAWRRRHSGYSRPSG
jgi:hypothetical protein